MDNFKPFSREIFWLSSAPVCKNEEVLKKKTAGILERFLLKAGNNDEHLPEFQKCW